jgi:hypothetical protein
MATSATSDGALVRNPAGRQHRTDGEKRRLTDLRRPILIRSVRVRRRRPSRIRAPYADRDNIGDGFGDYGGIILDPRNTGRTAAFFVVTPHNTQYDAITDDASAEGLVAGFLLGVGNGDRSVRLDARDSDSVQLASLPGSRSADLARLFVRGIGQYASSDLERLEKADRQFFVTILYAIQR